jgi:hypothetical protein
MPRNLINHTLGRGSNTQHRMAPTRNLSPPRIRNNLRHKPQTNRRGLQGLQILFTLDLQRNLRLTRSFPPFQNWRLGAEEVLVAC